MATPHINAKPGAFANIVLMPGDPLRAKWIAETYLHDCEEVTKVRGILGYTGLTKNGNQGQNWYEAALDHGQWIELKWIHV